MNVFKYFGIDDIRDLADRVLSGKPADLDARARLCEAAQATTSATGRELAELADALAAVWTGAAADAAVARLKTASGKRYEQAAQFAASAVSFRAVCIALVKVQGQARELVDTANRLGAALDRALSIADDAISVLSGAGIANWALKKATGVDLKAKAKEIVLDLTRPILDEALGLNSILEADIRAYERVLRAEAETIRTMPGIVRPDAGPVDQPGDADLRRDALFRSVYGRDPVSANDKLMAEALDLQGGDATNRDPNARVVVIRITPVPGAGVVHGSAFIGGDEVLNPKLDGTLFDKGDNRGFDRSARPDQSRVSFFVDYESGVVVVRQNASHASNGDVEVGNPSVGVEQDPAGRVRLRVDAANPLSPQIAQDANISVRGDVVIDPRGGHGPAEVNGKVTRFPSWEAYQTTNDGAHSTLLTRPEEAHPGGTGPLIGLPQPTVPVGEHPNTLTDWRTHHHPDHGHDTALDEILEFPTTRGDDFYDYPVDRSPYPSIDSNGHLVIPRGHPVG
ncbi:hypothetical protein [Actinokineospora terrae]|uniref:Uncharacterized protein n=1 Tax=Actinokineospora terrae TaxID=155974 RepID=A0A1H9X8N2_9PSEU|nr:hypothetical protein [Actinokineospora terrae]SES42485.1 hypothetical protein SAMN04487818_113145 [Actinokineospora terrae]